MLQPESRRDDLGVLAPLREKEVAVAVAEGRKQKAEARKQKLVGDLID